MNLPKTFKACLALIFVLFCTTKDYASQYDAGIRIVELAGLVVDAKTLSPLDAAEIFDANNTLLGTTDDKGYYLVKINCNSASELNFKFSVRKRGYHTINQHEHWADVNYAKGVMYFGLKPGGSNAKAFSVFGENKNEQDYQAVLRNFDKVKDLQKFNADLETAKAGNEDVLVHVNNKPYLVDSTGWILLYTDTDMVSIDNKQILPANELNTKVKRKQIKSMTTVAASDKKFVIYTR